jgi:hypothetical protein
MAKILGAMGRLIGDAVTVCDNMRATNPVACCGWLRETHYAR